MSERADARVNVTIAGTAGHMAQSQPAGLNWWGAATHRDQLPVVAVPAVRRCAEEFLRGGVRRRKQSLYW